jgi:hypothetical protein
VTVARGESAASAADAEAARCDVVRAMSTKAAEALRGCRQVVFERNGINGVEVAGTSGVCRRRRRSSACVAEEEYEDHQAW